MRCPECGANGYSRKTRTPEWRCRKCGHEWDVVTGGWELLSGIPEHSDSSRLIIPSAPSNQGTDSGWKLLSGIPENSDSSSSTTPPAPSTQSLAARLWNANSVVRRVAQKSNTPPRGRTTRRLKYEPRSATLEEWKKAALGIGILGIGIVAWIVLVQVMYAIFMAIFFVGSFIVVPYLVLRELLGMPCALVVMGIGIAAITTCYFRLPSG